MALPKLIKRDDGRFVITFDDEESDVNVLDLIRERLTQEGSKVGEVVSEGVQRVREKPLSEYFMPTSEEAEEAAELPIQAYGLLPILYYLQQQPSAPFQKDEAIKQYKERIGGGL